MPKRLLSEAKETCASFRANFYNELMSNLMSKHNCRNLRENLYKFLSRMSSVLG